MRVAPALVLLVLLVLLAPPAAAQDAPTLRADAEPPEPVAPGSGVAVPMSVRYCYQATGSIPATVEVAIQPPPAWLQASAEPRSFQAPATSGCGTRSVELRFAVGRDAPAFEPGMVKVDVTARRAGSTSSTSLSLPVQAAYAAELKANPPQRLQVRQGDTARLTLELQVSANAATRLLVTGLDPQGQVTVQGATPSTGAGRGLDQPESLRVPLTVAADGGARPGTYRVLLNVSTSHFQRPDMEGQRLTVPADVQVLGGSATPGFEALAGAAALALGGAALAQARRPRR